MSPIKVIIADDDHETRAWIRSLLRPLRVEIDDAASGWELLHKLAHDGPYALVISDVRMPAPSGLNVVTMARTAGLDVPFIVITAFPDDQIRTCLTRVANTWLIEKPFDGRELVDLVAVAARSAAAR